MSKKKSEPIKFKHIKVRRIPVTLTFKTKDGQEVEIQATKVVRVEDADRETEV